MQADSVTASNIASTSSPAAKQAADKAITSGAKPPTEKVTISNISITNTRPGRELYGEATNDDSVEHGAVIQATFYNVEGQIIDTEKAVLLQLRPGDIQTFNMSHVPDHDHSKVQLTMVTGS